MSQPPQGPNPAGPDWGQPGSNPYDPHAAGPGAPGASGPPTGNQPRPPSEVIYNPSADYAQADDTDEGDHGGSLYPGSNEASGGEDQDASDRFAYDQTQSGATPPYDATQGADDQAQDGGYRGQEGGYQSQDGGYQSQGVYGQQPGSSSPGGYDQQGAFPSTGGFAQPADYQSQGGYDQQGAFPSTGGFAQPAGYQPPSGYEQTQSYPSSGSTYTGPPPTGPQTGAGYPAQPSWGQPQPTSKKSRKGLWIGIGAAALVALLVAGYFVFFTGFQGIRNGKGDIANAKEFLSSAESTWQGTLPADGITVPDKTGCYYVMKDDNTVSGQIACGPTRRAAASEGAVWDLYDYSVSGSGDNQEAGELSEANLSQELPSKSYLATVDGDAPPDDGAGLEEPPLPKAESNGLWEGSDFQVDEANAVGTKIESGSDAKLIGPGAQVVVNSVVEYGAATVDGSVHQPADGQTFYLVTVTGDAGPVEGAGTIGAMSMELDGVEVAVPGLPDLLGEATFLVSAAKDGENYFVLDVEGFAQQLSLDTGEREPSATTDVYYTDNPVPTVPLNTPLAFGQIDTSPTDYIELTATAIDAKIVPYDEFEGWAGEGNVWLLIEGDQAASIYYPQLGGAAYTSYQLDCSASTVSTGTIKFCGNTDPGKFQILVEVPADARSFSLSVAMDMVAKGDTVPDVPVTFPAQPLEVNF